MAITISDTMLGALRQHICDMVSYAEYQAGGRWIRAEINSKSVQANGSVHVTFYIRKQPGGAAATAYRLKNADGQTLASREEEITFIPGIDTIMYRFKFAVTVGQNEGE